MSRPTAPHIQDFLNGLRKVRATGGDNQWVALCPCRNDDNTPTLSIGVGSDDKILLNCHRGSDACDAEEICKSMNLSVSALYPPETKKKGKGKKKIEATYQYLDEEFNPLYEKIKYRYEDGSKEFRQRVQDPNDPTNYIYTLKDVRRVLYNLPMLVLGIKSKQPIWVVEGEKDAETLIARDLIATTPPNGANTWDPTFTELLSQAEVVNIIADNDKPGRDHALKIQMLLQGAGCPKVSVFVSPHGKDVTDHINLGYKFSDLVRVDAELPEAQSNEPVATQSDDQVLLGHIADIFARDELETHQKVQRARGLLDSFGLTDLGDKGRLVVWSEFVNEISEDTYDWVIPGLIERQERIIVVAAEGVGKTMLARQIAILAGAGLHPFTFQPMPAIRTLTIDLENPERIIRRTSRWIMQQAIRFAKEKSGRHEVNCDAHLLIKPAGIDLISPTGRALFEETVDLIRPQLLCIGPLYKSYHDTGTLTSEALAVEVAKFLDYIRDVYDCALWIEHHAPLGQSQLSRELRPFGSAVWSRWPEFGLALAPDPTSGSEYIYDVKHFRGARDRRPWPIKMRRGVQFPFETLEFMKHDLDEPKSPVHQNEDF